MGEEDLEEHEAARPVLQPEYKPAAAAGRIVTCWPLLGRPRALEVEFPQGSWCKFEITSWSQLVAWNSG